MNPATKQYLVLAVVVSIIISFIINFALVNIVQGSLLYGFPFSLNGSEGIGDFFVRLINTIVMTVILIFPILLLLKELNRRR
jgi:hypothetical protein